MNTPRQRILNTFEFNNPDKIPVVYHPSTAGLYKHGPKLLDLFNEYPPDNPVDFNSIPAPSPGSINSEGKYYEIIRDEWGTEWEYLIFGVAGHPKNYPFASWEEALDYSFPSPLITVPAQEEVLQQRDNFFIFSGWISIFEKLHALRPMDEVLMDVLTGDRHLVSFLDRLVEFWFEVTKNLIINGVDVIVFGDDWGMQQSPMISPEIFREIFKPRYQKLMEPIYRAGRRAFLHCCGYMGDIFDDFLDLGISGLWPQITLYENDPSFIQKCIDHRVTIYIHPDRQQLIPLGTPAEIENAIGNYAEKYHKIGGGAIFYVEIENDAPFENVQALVESIHKYRTL